MNEQLSIEEQLQAELKKFKNAVDYIVQTENNIKQIQALITEIQTKYNQEINSNDYFISNLNNLNDRLKELTIKVEQINIRIDKLIDVIDSHEKAIQQNQKDIEKLKNLKWYHWILRFNKKNK
jgi:methyl-accepting chemotaxis protein